jgi:uncharacterized protein
MAILFKNSKRLEGKLDIFFNKIQESVLIFHSAIKDYLNNEQNNFLKKIDEISIVEREADNLRREIRHDLYTYMLIPESRGDVLGLLETSDEVIDISKKLLIQFDIEKPIIPEEIKDDIKALSRSSYKAADSMVKGIITYFKEPAMINHYINEVNHYEKEADNIELQTKRKIFNSKNLDLATKTHLRYFVEKVALVSDEAQEVTERLSVSAIKRAI